MLKRGFHAASPKFLALTLALLGILTSGCERISLAQLEPFDGAPRPNRPVVWAGGDLSQAYGAADHDILQVTSPSGAALSVRPSQRSIHYANNRVAAEIPVWLRNFLPSIIVSVDRGRSYTICFRSNIAGCSVDFSDGGAVEWERRIREGTGGELQARLVPTDPGWLRPGDEVDIELAYHLTLEDTNLRLTGRIVQAASRRAAVQSEGRISVPRIRLLSPILNENERGAADPRQWPGDAIPLQRAIAGTMEARDSTVEVWSPRNGGSPRPLWRLERCLNAVVWPDREPFQAEAAWCRNAGIDDRFHPEADPDIFRWQRYRLRPAVQSWALVDTNGARYSLPYHYGLSVQEAVATAYPRLTGRDLAADGHPLVGAPFLVVLPAADRNEAAFYGQAQLDGGAPPLTNIGLLAGDTVIIARYRPAQRAD